jgi:hypothetical protein
MPTTAIARRRAAAQANSDCCHWRLCDQGAQQHGEPNGSSGEEGSNQICMEHFTRSRLGGGEGSDSQREKD